MRWNAVRQFSVFSLRSMAVFCRAGHTSGEAAKFAREARENEQQNGNVIGDVARGKNTNENSE